jgi:hypothetical protein
MKTMKVLIWIGALAVCPALVRGDFSYHEETRITGGAMAGMMRFAGKFNKRANEPVETDIFVKGNKMARISRYNGEIIDLDAKTITQIDFQKKTYSVMTFEQMRQMMDQMAQSMKKQKQNPQEQNVQMKFKVDSKETGQRKTIAGMDAKEVLVTVEMDAQDQQGGQQAAMNLMSHVWLTAPASGYEQVRDFEKRMAEEGGFISPQQAEQMRQNMQGMVQLNSKMASLDGMPVETVVDMMMGSPNGSAAQQQQQQAQRQQQEQSSNGEGGLAGMAARGILGGFGRKKKNADSEQEQAPQAPPGTLMQITTDYSGFSDGSVDASKLQVPAGFQQVEAEVNPRPGR